MTPSAGSKEPKSLLMKMKEESEKVGLKLKLKFEFWFCVVATFKYFQVTYFESDLIMIMYRN